MIEMTILEQLEHPQFKVTKSDGILIDYVRKNKEKFVFKSISEIARESGIAEATVTRFVKKLGFNNFQSFKITFAQELSTSEEKGIVHSNISCDESIFDTASNLLHSTMGVLQKTMDDLDSDVMLKCKNAILDGRRIYIMGIGHSGVIAMDFHYKLIRIGLTTLSVSDGHMMLMLASIMGPQDVIIAISNSGETEELIQTIQLAKEQGVTIISITADGDNTLKRISHINLEYHSTETLFETGSITSKIPQIFMLDLIYTEIIKQTYNESLSRRLKTTDAIIKHRKN